MHGHPNIKFPTNIDIQKRSPPKHLRKTNATCRTFYTHCNIPTSSQECPCKTKERNYDAVVINVAQVRRMSVNNSACWMAFRAHATHACKISCRNFPRVSACCHNSLSDAVSTSRIHSAERQIWWNKWIYIIFKDSVRTSQRTVRTH
jgi:hypothetical protein